MAADSVHAIGSHGQTVLHLPNDSHPRTLQIGDPARIAVMTGITTVADFRRNDIAAGGQGAPLACAFHAWQFRDTGIDRIVLNLGGMANITLLPTDANREITGFDTGPGNALMDSWIQRHQGQQYDHEGEWATSGRAHPALLKAMLAEPYFSLAPPKSTGKDEFHLDWLAHRIAETGSDIASADVQASLLELTARTVTTAITTHAADTRQILVCGGGVHNRALLNRLIELLPGRSIDPTDDYGVAADAVEAVTFAWLAQRRMEQLPANLPSVTGARFPVLLGAIYQR
jgi:anhydro-N-acetylmuramic acid kinase